jgi:4-amino-4-deoxy-L-arabinose transferase-like glycosyltransferase
MLRTSSASPSQSAHNVARTQTRTWPRLTATQVYLAVLILIGLALRIWFIVVNDIDPRFSAADDGDYYQRALRLAVTGQYVDNSWLIRPPGHVLMFAALLRLAIEAGNPVLGIDLIRAVQVGLSLALIPIGYDLARRLFQPTAGLIFAGVLAVWFPMVELPALILSEPLFVMMLVAHSWMLVRWRDRYHAGGSRAWLWLAGAGIVLAIGALARSPALYASVFAVAFVVVETWRAQAADTRWSFQPAWIGAWLRRAILAGLVFMLPFVMVIAPWTTRNYLTYNRLIIIDTLGPVNLWMAMSDAVNEGRGEGEAKAILAGIPQAERQDFVSSEIGRIVREEPERLVRNFWPHFIHIWKAQFVEDFFVKVSFYTRPLRDVWAIGAVGDLIWLIFTTAAWFGLAARPREGGFRLVALGWIAYSCLTVMLIHVEPRYLLPVWIYMALYGSAVLAGLWAWGRQWRHDRPSARAATRGLLRSPWSLAGIGLMIGFLAIFFSYRDYPRIIADGVQRELYRAAGTRAVAAGEYQAAIGEFEQMLTYHPTFIDGRVDLARAHMALGQYDEAWAALGERATHRSDVIRGALARAQDDPELATLYFEDAEVRAGEDVQKLAMEWLPLEPTSSLTLGNGVDFGYLDGFSFGEDLPPQTDGDIVSFRWLQGSGIIRLPLPEPLSEGDVLQIRMAGGTPGISPLEVSVGSFQTTLPVRGGEWRVFHLPVPADLVGQTEITVLLQAPTFIPLQSDPTSTDARLLSVMISRLSLE